MVQNEVHVVPNPNGGWDVKQNGRVLAHFVLQSDAKTKGIEVAKRYNTEFFLHGRDGKIIERNSYGNDPYPPKG